MLARHKGAAFILWALTEGEDQAGTEFSFCWTALKAGPIFQVIHRPKPQDFDLELQDLDIENKTLYLKMAKCILRNHPLVSYDNCFHGVPLC